MKNKIKLGLNIILRVIFVLLIMLILDVFCIFIINRPLFALRSDNVYEGLFFNVYDCDDDLEIKSKRSKFSCSESKLIDYGIYRLSVKKSESCNNELKLYFDGERKVYLSCIDEVYVDGDSNVNNKLKDFMDNDITKLDKILDNYDGQPYNDGGSISYTIRYRGEIFRVDRCHKLSGNYNIYIGNKNMKFMCNREND